MSSTSNFRVVGLNFIKKNKILVFGAGTILFGVILTIILVNVLKPKPENAVQVADFSKMNQSEVIKWCGDNSVQCSISQELAKDKPKGEFVSQSIAAGDYVGEGESLKIVFSRGELPEDENYQNALNTLETTANATHMPESKIVNDLKRDYGDEAANWAVENSNVDWDTICLARAADYYRGAAYDSEKNAILQQYSTKHEIRNALAKDGFTESQINFAIQYLSSTVGAEVGE